MKIIKYLLCFLYLSLFHLEGNIKAQSDTGIITGYIWLDINGNSEFDPGEYGLTDVEVLLSADGDTLSTFSLMDGAYTFSNLELNEYVVSLAAVPNGLIVSGSSSQVILLNPEQQVANINFPLVLELVIDCSYFEISHFSTTESVCAAIGTGTIDIEWIGGASPYILYLDNNLVGEQESMTYFFDNVSGGAHTVIIEDSSHCLIAQELLVPQINAIHYNIEIPIVNCNDSSVQVSVTVEDANTSELSITIDDEEPAIIVAGELNIFTLSLGEHIILFSDNNGCTQSENILIEPSTIITADAEIISPSDCGLSDGSAHIIVSGGSGDYIVTSDVGIVDGLNINDLSAGTYSALINDVVCSLSDEISIIISDPIPCNNGGNHPPCVDTASVCTAVMTTYAFCLPQCDPDGDHMFILDHSVSLWDCAIHLQGDTCVRYTPLPGFVGQDFFTLTVCDDNADQQCVEWLVNVYVGVCSLTAANDTVTTDANEPVTISVLTNDDSPLDVPFTIISTSDPDHGSVSISADGTTIIYTPDPGFSGGDSFSYTIMDENGLPASALVIVEVIASSCLAEAGVVLAPLEDCIPYDGFNLAPSVSGQNQSEGFIYAYILTTDLIAGDTISYDVLSINATGSFDFQNLGLDPGFYSIHGISFYGTGNDLESLNLHSVEELQELISNEVVCAEVIVPGYLLEVSTTNCSGLPSCENTTYLCSEAMEPVGICFEFCDILGTGAVIDSLITSWNCSIVLTSDTCVTYTALPGFSGMDSVIAIACNPLGICDTAIAYITVGCAQPVANPDEYIVAVSESAFLDVLQNDTDLCGRPLVATIISYPEHGTLVISGDGYLYTPDPEYSGLDGFNYLACNDCTVPHCDETQVTITVINDTIPPSGDIHLSPDIGWTTEGDTVVINVLNNDSEGLTVTGTSQAANGTVMISNDGSSVIYTPNDGFTGSDYFYYTACNEEGICDVTYVSVIVISSDAGNMAPAGNNDVAETSSGVPVLIDVLANDTDPDGGELIISEITNVSCGTAVIIEGQISYDPGINCNGDVLIDYILCDNANPALCDTVMVLVGVNTPPSNTPPVATSDTIYLTVLEPIFFNVSDNDSDIDGDAMQFFTGSDPSCGSFQLDPTGLSLYIPESDCAEDLIMYIVCDDAIVALCDTAYILINYINTNPTLLIQPDVATTTVDTPVLICPLDNDSGDSIILSGFQQPENGTVTLDEATGCLLYTPESGFSGVDNFVYTVCDENGNCGESLVAITVLSGDNLPPVAGNDVVITDINTPAIVFILLNDSDPENGPLTITEISIPAELQEVVSSAVINDDGSITIVTVPNYSGQFVISYTVCDNQNLCTTADILVVVGGVAPLNHSPVAANDNLDLFYGESGLLCVMNNDLDEDGDYLSISILSDPAYGTISINSEGCVSYVPDGSFLGTDYFTYLLCDSGSPILCDTAFASIHISPEPGDTIVITADDSAETSMNDSLHVLIFENDTIVPGSAQISFEIIQGATNGELTIVNDDSFDVYVIYTPNQGFIGSDTFYYQICVDQICDTAEVVILIAENEDECTIIAMNGLSPNGDGYGESFILEAADCNFDQIKLRIFNRWGNEVYYSEDYPNEGYFMGKWEKNSNPLPDGTYYYIAEIYLAGEKINDKAGYLEIFR